MTISALILDTTDPTPHWKPKELAPLIQWMWGTNAPNTVRYMSASATNSSLSTPLLNASGKRRLEKIDCRCTANALTTTSTTTIELLKNGALAGAYSFPFLAGATGLLTHSEVIDFADGDTWDIRVTIAAGGGTQASFSVALFWSPLAP